MHVTMTGVLALEQLRAQLEEDAGADFPQDVRTELLVLYDVCRGLNLGCSRCARCSAMWAGPTCGRTLPVGLPTAHALTSLAASPAPHRSAEIG